METTVLILSHNKGEYVSDAVESVLAQTRQDFRIWLIDDGSNEETKAVVRKYEGHPKVTVFWEDCDPRERQKFYRPSVLLNRYMEGVETELLAFLADDDVWHPQYLEKLVGFLEEHDYARIAYCATRCVALLPDGREVEYRIIPADRIYDYRFSPDCRIDGGSIVHYRACLDVIDKPWYPEPLGPLSHHVDGLFMAKLARHFKFYPVDEILLTHRATPKSWHSRVIDGQIVFTATDSKGPPPGA